MHRNTLERTRPFVGLRRDLNCNCVANVRTLWLAELVCFCPPILLTPQVAAMPAKLSYAEKKQALELDDAMLAPHYVALLEVQKAWFSGRSYAAKESLIADAAAGPGPAEDFVRYFLALRVNKGTRITFAQFRADALNHGKAENNKTRHYWRALVGRIWDHYISAPRMQCNEFHSHGS